jgi:peptidyl-prolyl cis-trans isomerase B (cyclophilin B)
MEEGNNVKRVFNNVALRLAALCVALAVILGITAASAAAQNEDFQKAANMRFQVDGKEIDLSKWPDSYLLVKEGSTFLPVRALGESVGGKVNSNMENQTSTGNELVIDVFCNNNHMCCRVITASGKTTSSAVLLNDLKVEIEVAILDGRTYMPLRAVSEALGLDVKWDPATRTIDVKSPAGNSNSDGIGFTNKIQATITMEDGGQIVLELYPDIAPQTVRNFVYLARQGFYDGLKFHRIMKGFMIQGGDPEGSGMGGPGYTIKGEFQINGVNNDLKHTRGVISMARQGDPAYNSAGSQFFIMHADSPFLDGSYAAFGQVISGMDVVDNIADTPNSGGNGAVAEQEKKVIKTVTIDDDIELPEPYMLK